MENQQAKKQIETALGQFFLRYRYAFLVKVWDRIITHLAEEVIAIEVEVEHTRLPKGGPKTLLFASQDIEPHWSLNAAGSGHLGSEGKALAIIVSLEEAKDGN